MRFRSKASSVAVLGVVAVLVVAACTSSKPSDSERGALDPQTGTLPTAARDVMTRSSYEGARWTAKVVEVDSGRTVLALNADDLMFMGSNMKLFTVGMALETLGPEQTMTTPVYRVGDELVLVASGDLALGARMAGSGALAYSVPPQPDANGIPGAKVAPGDPLAGLNALAEQVVANGVTSASDVVVDDRLFQAWETPDGLTTPIVVNDNLVAVLTSPGHAEGDPATIRTVPDSTAFTVVNDVTTGDSGPDLPSQIEIEAGESNQIIVSGIIAPGTPEVLNVYEVPDPASYARTLLIEALRRAGVTVEADEGSVNDPSGLPSAGSYEESSRVASLDSPPYKEQAQLIWKISHNLGANVSLCLLAVKAGSTDCTDGFGAIRDQMQSLDISPSSAWFVDGAGSDPSEVSASAMVDWVRWVTETVGADQVMSMLPIMGVDGSLSQTGADGPGKGKLQAKTGTSASIDQSDGRLLMKGKSLAGLMESDAGQLYAFALYMNNGTYDGLQNQVTANEDLSDVAVAIQQSL